MLTVAPQQTDAAARRDLRAQIARLERELAETAATTYPWIASGRSIAHGGPRLLTLAELERTRDALAAAVGEVRERAAGQRAAQAEARARLEAMYRDPAAFKGARVSNEQLGLPGCTVYAVRPRFGPIGLLTGWWRVTVSSGCP
ncbi:MAG TPA: hypothetical protein VFZ00_13635 [Solirubrobacter sp.]|nr:hypothetical protein [Solirubrobacter sp.]